MSADWIIVTFYFILTTSGSYWIYKRVKSLTTGKYISISKIDEVKTKREAREAILKAVHDEKQERNKAVTGEF